MISAIVLAAGLSERMGSNKLLLPFHKKTVIETTIGQILESGMDEVIVVTGHEAAKTEEVLKSLPVTLVYNQYFKNGMTSSIQAGVTKAKHEGYMICLGDMVLIEPREYKLIKDVFEQQLATNPYCICIPRYNGKKGNPVIFSTHYRKVILNHAFPDGCRKIVQEHKENIHWVEMNSDHVLIDMDNPGDYKRLQF